MLHGQIIKEYHEYQKLHKYHGFCWLVYTRSLLVPG